MRCKCGEEIIGIQSREDYCEKCNIEIDIMLESLKPEDKSNDDRI